MANPLIATPIVNKLGVATTVHKRAGNDSSSHVSMPAPALAVPQKTEKEIVAEHRSDLVERILEHATANMESLDPANYELMSKGLNNLWTDHLETLSSMIDEQPRYRTYLMNSMKQKLMQMRTFSVSIQLSVHDLANALDDAGFDDVAISEGTVEDYFGQRGPGYLKQDHINDFRTWYLVRALGMADDEMSNDGKMDYYRKLSEVHDNYDGMVKALPIINTMYKIDFYNVQEDFEIMLKVAKHVENRSPEDISRIASFLEARPEEYQYDEYLLDEMLEEPAGAMLNDGFL